MTKSPTSVTIRTYQVGFGDCFLLSFRYGPTSERHVLIDFGSTGVPKGVTMSKRMMKIAEDIEKRTNKKLHAVVATHRHKDHISGFTTKKGGKGTGDVIKRLKPQVVVQPWTEDPKLARKATGPKSQKSKTALAIKKKFGNGTQQQVAALSLMNEFALHTLQARNLPRAIRNELQFLGESNLSNASAVKNLMSMAKNSYVYCGTKSGLEKVLPGVKIHVLGPPTVKQTDTIKKQRSRDPDEFWHFQVDAIRSDDADSGNNALFSDKYVRSRGPNYPVNARWVIYHARTLRGEQLLQIVRMLDKQMNNTSVILVFQVGKKKLLFPGDAQIENWEYALGQKKFQSLLSDVDVYKVGHHGSLNATPKSLWKLFKQKSKKKTATRLKSLMSTMAGKHGSAHSDTEVPRGKLVHALEQESDFFSTQQLKGQNFFRDTTLTF